MNDQIGKLLSSLRDGPFSDLADYIEARLAAGKEQQVRQVKEKRRSRDSIETITFEPVSGVAMPSPASAKRGDVYLQVVPYSDAEAEQLVLRILQRKFSEPRRLIEALKEAVGSYDLASIEFVSPVNEAERISLTDCVQVFAGEEEQKFEEVLRSLDAEQK